MTTYNVYLSGQKKQIDADPNDTLSSLRQKLGNDANDYDFVYYNTFTKKKTILNDRGVESDQTISSATFPGNTLIMTVVQGQKTDLFGMKTDWMYDRHTGVQITLNQNDEVARQQNVGKFAPIMLTDIQPSNSSSSAFYQRAVICEKDSIIQFNISSWGAAGFGYSITSDKDTICDSLYITYGDQPNHQGFGSLWRYEGSNNTIQIESTQLLNIPTEDVIHYQKVTVKTWRVTSYQQDGKTFTSNTQAPLITAPLRTRMMTPFDGGTRFFSLAATMGGFDPGSPGGNTYVPGKDIETGAPGRGPESGQQFGSISDIQQDDPNNTVLGAVVFYFFVFKDHEAANRVINVLNAPNPNAIG
ncbi:hypothetical protein [Crocosphaera sp. XPORK-15E]|uniref:hypothetical protein n=1 Tax=Crocosphaera sp. XPORK-15E TaxID=3110247 RepID=UPI002B21255A|nr:hypothetical protein [Crocosphaera sp. XPORK-15E]MEA5536946.1 hypothetical protein [Crocosphaera sp. XPORK-15E]